MVEINIEKKHLYLLTAVLVFLAGIAIVIAADNASFFGHSVDEIDWSQEISQINVQELCIGTSGGSNGNGCQTSWPLGSLPLLGGAGISISGNTIEVLEPSLSSNGLGGVTASTCSSNQKVTAITGGGTLTCSQDV
jgi:hypothetical protein